MACYEGAGGVRGSGTIHTVDDCLVGTDCVLGLLGKRTREARKVRRWVRGGGGWEARKGLAGGDHKGGGYEDVDLWGCGRVGSQRLDKIDHCIVVSGEATPLNGGVLGPSAVVLLVVRMGRRVTKTVPQLLFYCSQV